MRNIILLIVTITVFTGCTNVRLEYKRLYEVKPETQQFAEKR